MDSVNYTSNDPLFDYVSQIDPDLECPVCRDPLKDPVMHSTCRNTFCRQCLLRCVTCPMDRTVINRQTDVLPVPLLVQRALDQLAVRCKHCGQQTRKEQIPYHWNNECALPCPRSCGASITRATFMSHQTECPLAVAECSAAKYLCPFRGPQSAIAAHEAECPFVKVAPTIQRLLDEKKQVSEEKDSLLEEKEELVDEMERLRNRLLRLVSAPQPRLNREQQQPQDSSADQIQHQQQQQEQNQAEMDTDQQLQEQGLRLRDTVVERCDRCRRWFVPTLSEYGCTHTPMVARNEEYVNEWVQCSQCGYCPKGDVVRVHDVASGQEKLMWRSAEPFAQCGCPCARHI